jgi:hypothetical protein
MSKTLRDNGLSLTLAALFVVFLAGQTLTGWRDENRERRHAGKDPESLTAYIASGAFVEATAENFESEFLQAFAYVWLTARLFQRGSAESKDPDKDDEDVDREPDPKRKGAPKPVRDGGIKLWLYERSLGIAFLALFAASFVAHAIGGRAEFNEEALEHGEAPIGMAEFMVTSRFWFQSFQNWQSEFLALLLMVVLTIWLRQRGSPESKPVDAPHAETGC